MPFERISINPNICHGQACVKGTRIPVHQIVRMLANGDTVDAMLYQTAGRATLARMELLALYSTLIPSPDEPTFEHTEQIRQEFEFLPLIRGAFSDEQFTARPYVNPYASHC
jgi:hypothetical protein